jgi:hypothetical protein
MFTPASGMGRLFVMNENGRNSPGRICVEATTESRRRAARTVDEAR